LSNDAVYEQYAEALAALQTVDARRKAALRAAVESASQAENEAKSQMANQQRMYNRAGTELLETERTFSELQSLLGAPIGVAQTQSQDARSAPQLAEIRATVLELADWAGEAKSDTESLQRTLSRLDTSPGTPPAQRQPASVEQDNSRRVLLVLVIAMAVVTAITVLAIINS